MPHPWPGLPCLVLPSGASHLWDLLELRGSWHLPLAFLACRLVCPAPHVPVCPPHQVHQQEPWLARCSTWAWAPPRYAPAQHAARMALLVAHAAPTSHDPDVPKAAASVANTDTLDAAQQAALSSTARCPLQGPPGGMRPPGPPFGGPPPAAAGGPPGQAMMPPPPGGLPGSAGLKPHGAMHGMAAPPAFGAPAPPGPPGPHGYLSNGLQPPMGAPPSNGNLGMMPPAAPANGPMSAGPRPGPPAGFMPPGPPGMARPQGHQGHQGPPGPPGMMLPPGHQGPPGMMPPPPSGEQWQLSCWCTCTGVRHLPTPDGCPHPWLGNAMCSRMCIALAATDGVLAAPQVLAQACLTSSSPWARRAQAHQGRTRSSRPCHHGRPCRTE